MSDRSFEDRVKDAQYKAMVEGYRQRHKHDAQKEPEEETELQRMARYVGAPAPGKVPIPQPNPLDALNRRLMEAFFDD